MRYSGVMLVAVLLAFGTAVAAQQDVRRAVEAQNKRFVAAAAKADTAAIGGLYTDDAQAFPPNSDVVKGRAAIQQMWKGVFDSGVAGASLETSDVESQGDLAYETGRYEMKLKDGKAADRGKYVVVWKRIGGEWRIHRDIWNTSMSVSK
jgi:uncharacterized protein (TIGR02246 family)